MQNPLGDLFDIVSGIVPVDSQTGANTGDYISLKNCSGVLFLANKAVGSGTDDPVLKIQQATSVAAGSAKDLAVIDTYYKKEGALLTAVGTWTKVTQAASTQITLTGSAQLQGKYAFFVPSEALDADNGFDCIQLSVADTGAAGVELMNVDYILVGLRFAAAPENLPSSIVD
jgi:hypothetical protein